MVTKIVDLIDVGSECDASNLSQEETEEELANEEIVHVENEDGKDHKDQRVGESAHEYELILYHYGIWMDQAFWG